MTKPELVKEGVRLGLGSAAALSAQFKGTLLRKILDARQ